MLTARYPARKRCRNRKCRKFFGSLVLDGQWCSYACADHPAPSVHPSHWPRQHFKLVTGGRRIAKVPYASEMEALAAHYGSAQAYRCDYCLMWHRATVRA